MTLAHDVGPCPACGYDGERGIDGECPECGHTDEACPECGAPPGMPCDPGCPNAEAHDHGVHECTQFDRFMDVALVKEARSRGVDAEAPSPQRRLARSYQEHPLGRVRVGARR